MRESACDEDLIRRLPLPLAQLYRRAHNAKTPLEQHQAAWYLWEAALKLLGSTAVVASAEFSRDDPDLLDRLKCLARPALGHWWEIVRRLVPVSAEKGDAGFVAVRDLVLGRTRDDLPRAAGLDAALRQALESGSGARVAGDGTAGQGGERSSVRLTELLDRLVRYRNRELGHGAAGQRSADFYERMGRALLAGAGEVLGRLDVLAGRALIFVEEIRRQESGAWRLERYELRGESARRIESLDLPASSAESLPRPRRVHLQSADGLRSLHPLVIFDPEASEAFFLSARRGQRRSEHLSYASGRILEIEALEGDEREFLGRILGQAVDPAAAEAWRARSQAEEEGNGPRSGGETNKSLEGETVHPDAPPSTHPGAPGGRRLGGFELLSRIGRGGMGVVYRAWQPSLGRQVALKCLLRSGDPKAETRFAREIRSLGRVEHPHLVKVFTSGSEGDQWFYAMELLEGADLASVCERLAGSSASEVSGAEWERAITTAQEEVRRREEPLGGSEGSDPRAANPSRRTTPESATATPSLEGSAPRAGRGHIAHAVEIVRQVAGAAHALHEAGVIHRDIKPGNILLSSLGAHAVLMDLGLAQLADDAEGKLTRTRQFVGTLRYSSPEQILAAAPLDRRSDVYSLGATLWELLTLKPIFGAGEGTSTPELMLRIQSEEPARPRRFNALVSPDLEAIVLKCLEKSPARRYLTALELSEDLARWQRGEPVGAERPTVGYVLGKFIRRHRAAVTAAAIVLLALVAGTTFAFWRVNRARLENQARWVTQLVENGVRIMDGGDPLGALPYFAKALEVEKGNVAREEIHRMRISSILRRAPKLVHLFVHAGPVYYAEWSRDGKRAVTASEDGTARVWDGATGEAISPPLRHAKGVRYARFSPDGHRVVTASWDSSARVWDPETGQPVTLPLEHGGAVRYAEFSPDGRRVVTASDDGTARVWDSAAGTPVSAVLRHKDDVFCASFSPDGRHVVTGSLDSTARVWDAATGEPLALPLKDIEPVYFAWFSPDGSRILTTSNGGNAQQWEAGTWRPLARPIRHEGGGVFFASYGADGRRVATACNDGTARVWDAATGEAITPPLRHDGRVHHVDFSPDGRRIATASYDGLARVWDASSGDEISLPMKHGGNVRFAFFHPEGRRLLTAGGDGIARVWDLARGDPITLPMKNDGPIINATFSPDGGRIVVAGDNGKVRLWEPRSGEAISPPNEHSWTAFSLSYDVRQLVTADQDGSARIWELATGRTILSLLDQGGQLVNALFSPDAKLVALTDKDGTVRVWDAVTGNPISLPMKQAYKTSNTTSLSADSRFLLTSAGKGPYDDSEVQLWDVATGISRFTLPHRSQINVALFSPDSRSFLTGSFDGVARLWDAATGREILSVMHKGPILHASYSKDGLRALTASQDGTVLFWDARTGEPLIPPLKHHGSANSAALSSSGGIIFTSSADGASRLWDAATGQAITPPFKPSASLNVSSLRPDGYRVVTGHKDGTAWIWSFEPDRRPVEDLLLQAELTAGARLDADGRLIPIDPALIPVIWAKLHDRYPVDFTSSPEERVSWHRREAEDCERRGEWAAAIAHLDRVVELKPASWMDRAASGRVWAKAAFAGSGERWSDAARDFTLAITIGADESLVWQCLALVQLESGDEPGLKKTVAQMLDRFGKSEDQAMRDRLARISSVAFQDGVDPARLLDLTRRPSGRESYALAVALYRAGKFEESSQCFEKLSQAEGHTDGPFDLLFQALAHQRLGHAEKARELLKKGQEQKPGEGWNWYDTLQLRHLEAEARALIEKN